MKLRKILVRLAVLVVLVGIGMLMMLIGRGHTVYIDNKTLEYNGVEYPAFYKVEIDTKGAEKTIKLEARDRGAATCIGQNFRMNLTITEKKDSEPRVLTLDVKLPYNMDGPILNLPALLADLPQDAWLDEFIPTVPDEPEDEQIPGADEFGLDDDMGLDDDTGLGDDMGDF